MKNIRRNDYDNEMKAKRYGPKITTIKPGNCQN